MTLCQHTQGGCWHPVCSPPTWALEPPTMALGSSRGARDQRGMSPAQSTQRQKPGLSLGGRWEKSQFTHPNNKTSGFCRKARGLPASKCLLRVES